MTRKAKATLGTIILKFLEISPLKPSTINFVSETEVDEKGDLKADITEDVERQ